MKSAALSRSLLLQSNKMSISVPKKDNPIREKGISAEFVARLTCPTKAGITACRGNAILSDDMRPRWGRTRVSFSSIVGEAWRRLCSKVNRDLATASG